MKEKLVIVGIGSTGKRVYDFVKDYDLFDVIGFAVNDEYRTTDVFCDLPVYSVEKLDEIIDKKAVKVFVAILWDRLNSYRRRVYESLKARGFIFANIISPHSVIRGKINGTNCWVKDYVIVQTNVEIEEDTFLMASCFVGADTKIGPHCFIATRSTVAGCCVIGEQSFVGLNCTVFDYTTVGKKCILGACTVVKRNVPDFSVVKTNISDMIIKQLSEDEIETKLLSRKNVR